MTSEAVLLLVCRCIQLFYIQTCSVFPFEHLPFGHKMTVLFTYYLTRAHRHRLISLELNTPSFLQTGQRTPYGKIFQTVYNVRMDSAHPKNGYIGRNYYRNLEH